MVLTLASVDGRIATREEAVEEARESDYNNVNEASERR